MRKPRFFSCCVMLFGFASAGILHAASQATASPASASKPKTFAVIVFREGAKPSLELIGKAAEDISGKMKGLREVNNAEEADHIVQVLFKRGQYKIYIDSLPLGELYSSNDRGLELLRDSSISRDMAWDRKEHPR